MRQESQWLEAVYEDYASKKRGDDVIIAQRYREFQNTIFGMEFKIQDAISSSVHLLCAEYERAAYLDGVRTGAQIILELQCGE